MVLGVAGRPVHAAASLSVVSDDYFSNESSGMIHYGLDESFQDVGV